jgi:hypothetical protein
VSLSEIIQRYGILGYPTLNLYRDGEVVTQVIGGMPKRLLPAALGGHIWNGTGLSAAAGSLRS